MKIKKCTLFQNIFHKSTVFQEITISYIALLIISVLVTGCITYFKTYSIVYNNIQNSNLETVKNLEQKVRNVLAETDSVSISLQGWPAIKKIFTMTEELDESWVSDDELFNLVYVLRKHKALHSYIDNMAIIFRDVDLVIDCTSASSTYEEFFEYRFSFESETFHGIKDIDFTKSSLLLPNCKVGRYSQPNQDCLLYFKSIPNAAGVPKAMLLVTLKPDSLMQLLDSSLVFGDEMWLIQDNIGQVILSGTDFSEQELAQLSIPENTPKHSGYATWNGKHCAFYHLNSEITGLSFSVFFPLNHITGQFMGTILFMAVSLIITIVLGILLAYYYARKSYAPIQKIASAVSFSKTEKKGENNNSINEFFLIEESLKHLTDENDILKESISKHMPIIRNNLLNKLLNSSLVTDSDRAEMEKYSIHFPFSCFFVGVVSIEAMQLYADEELIISSASNALFYSCIEEFFAAQDIPSYLAEMQDKTNFYAVILNTKSDAPTPVKALFAQLPGFIRRHLSASVEAEITIGISNASTRPVNFKTLYYQALHALEAHYSLTCGVIWYGDLKDTPSVSYNFTINDELKLGNLIKSVQKAEALSFTNAVLDDFFSQGRIRREDAVYIFNQILFICAKVIHETHARSADIIDFKKLHSLNLFTQMNEYTLSCVAAACDTISNLHKSAESELSERIVLYIQDNFRSYDMTLSYLAEHFHVSAIYVSRAVKKTADISFIDYLSRLRIDESKRLLTETNTNIRDIAVQVGFDSDKNFIRVFKKYEGITPGQYRKSEIKS